MKKILLATIFIVLSLSFTGCRTSQIQNVPNQHFTADNSKISNEDVYKAIKKAGTGLGWIVHKNSNKSAEATLRLRDHVAVVTVDYNLKDYSISYKSSTNLKYDKEDNTIHSNYNGWITNLNNAIQVQLSAL